MTPENQKILEHMIVAANWVQKSTHTVYNGYTQRLHIIKEKVHIIDKPSSDLMCFELDQANVSEDNFAQDLIFALRDELSIDMLDKIILAFQKERDEQEAKRQEYIKNLP